MAKTEHNSYRVRDTRRVVYVSVVVSGEKEGLVIVMVTGRRRVRAWVMVQSIKNSSFSPRDDDVVRTCGICPMCLAGLEYVKDRRGLERPMCRAEIFNLLSKERQTRPIPSSVHAHQACAAPDEYGFDPRKIGGYR